MQSQIFYYIYQEVLPYYLYQQSFVLICITYINRILDRKACFGRLKSKQNFLSSSNLAPFQLILIINGTVKYQANIIQFDIILIYISKNNMKSIQVLIVALVLYNCYAAKFNIASTSSCTSTSAAGFCTKWQQNGTVEQQTAACFSASMILLTKYGYKSFDQLQIGDQILSYDRQKGEIFTKIRGWFHRDNETDAQFLEITLDNNQKILVSEKHNIALQNQNSQLKFVFANQVDKTQKLFGTVSMVQKINLKNQKGMYAPMTWNNNYFVFSSKSIDNRRILAHDYANIRNPQGYQSVANMLLSVYEHFNGVQKQIKGIHPGAGWIMNKFEFLMQ